MKQRIFFFIFFMHITLLEAMQEDTQQQSSAAAFKHSIRSGSLVDFKDNSSALNHLVRSSSCTDFNDSNALNVAQEKIRLLARYQLVKQLDKKQNYLWTQVEVAVPGSPK